MFVRRIPKDRGGRINRVWAYHNALSVEVRLRNLRSFGGDAAEDGSGEGTDRILVCTDRVARVIDFDGTPVDHVVLFNFPKEPAEEEGDCCGW